MSQAVGNMDTNYDHDILISLNLKTNKIHILDMQEICSSP